MQPALLNLIALVAMVVAVSCSRQAPADKVKAAEAPTVAVARAARVDLSREVTLTSEFIPFQEVEVMAKVSGYVQRINVDVGDSVRQGQVIAVLEVPEMRDDIVRTSATVERSRAEVTRAQDEVERAEKAHQIAHLSYSRLATLFKQQPGLIAQQEVDDALAKDQIAEAQVSGAKSMLAASRQQIKVGEADRGKAETLLQYTQVLAPFDGVVTKRYANTGSMIQSGVASQSQAMPLVRLSQNSRLRLVLDVPESSAGLIKTGSVVKVKIPALRREFPGKVARTSDRVSTSTRTMHAEVDVPNPSRELIPGMYAEVILRLEDRPRAIAVPLTAIEKDPAENESSSASVLIVNRAGVIERRPVKTGIESATQVEIVSGLSEGDTVVLSASGQVKDGQTVRPKGAN